MGSILWIFAALTGPLFQASANDGQYRGPIRLESGRELYVDHRPAVGDKPTLFLLNGLTWDTRHWGLMVNALKALDPEIGVVLYDMEGMGRTLLNRLPPLYEIPFADQAEDLHELRGKLSIRGPCVAAGLSYGGGVALKASLLHPDDFDSYVAIAPYLEPVPEHDAWIRRSIATHRNLYPLDPRSEDDLYDFYLRGVVNTFPALEPIILENPFKLEAIYRMIKSARHWVAADHASQFPAGRIHVMAASRDEFVTFDRIQYFLSSVPPGVIASAAVVQDPPLEKLGPYERHHKIPELRPKLTAAWLRQILNGNPDLRRGLTFWLDPVTGEARSGSLRIPLEVSHDGGSVPRGASGPR